jgi:hypothetical protein
MHFYDMRFAVKRFGSRGTHCILKSARYYNIESQKLFTRILRAQKCHESLVVSKTHTLQFTRFKIRVCENLDFEKKRAEEENQVISDLCKVRAAEINSIYKCVYNLNI